MLAREGRSLASCLGAMLGSGSAGDGAGALSVPGVLKRRCLTGVATGGCSATGASALSASCGVQGAHIDWTL